MSERFAIELLRLDERPAVHALLKRSRLPIAGFDDPHVLALVPRDAGQLVGSCAIEVLGRYGLLRSVAVAEQCRGMGLGGALTKHAIDEARARGLSALYLLTETAEGFFPRFGFAPVARDDVPPDVRRSVEFTAVCPASALALVLPL